MNLYRITLNKFATDISGAGAKLYGGRWNPKGNAILYTAQSRALAALELLAHTIPTIVPNELKLVTISVPNEVDIPTIPDKDLPPNWRDFPAPYELKTIGQEWIESMDMLAMKVPSALIPKEYNFLLNPLHLDFNKIEIISIEDFSYDERLMQ